MEKPWLGALLGTGFTFLLTAVGAAAVFCVPKGAQCKAHRSFFGFAAGVMLAASVWSLLLPAQELAVQQGHSAWLPPAAGFIAGGIFLGVCERIIPGLNSKTEGGNTRMLVFAVTLHNLPEGMAVGLSFAVAALTKDAGALVAAAVLALGVGLQNLPEGAAISMPLCENGMSRQKAFLCGALSGLVEPVGGLAGVLLAVVVARVLPFLLSFAAGAMIYVVVEELVPEAKGHEGDDHAGTIGTMLGFVLMMTLDVALK